MKDSVKEILKRGAVSFSISAFAGLAVNLIVDMIVNAAGNEGYISISPDAQALFPTPAISAYINVLMYGLIGAAFAMMTFIYQIDRLGFVIQSILYFLSTAVILTVITSAFWKLHKYPQALIPTLAGYAITYLIMGITQYKALKRDISEINKELQIRED